MATSTFSFSGGTEGSDFNVALNHSSAIGTSVNATVITSITCNGITFNLGPASFNGGLATVRRKDDFANLVPVLAPTERLYEYITWRSQNTSSHPTSGKGFDLWLSQTDETAQRLLIDIAGGLSWNTAINTRGPTFQLNPNRYSVVYDYDAQYAIGYKKGGIVQWSYTP